MIDGIVIATITVLILLGLMFVMMSIDILPDAFMVVGILMMILGTVIMIYWGFTGKVSFNKRTENTHNECIKYYKEVK